MKKNLVNLTMGGGILCFLTPMFSAHAENSLKETETSFDLSCVYQNERISGTVVDQEGNPVIGANVIIKGTQNGTITDLNGQFILEDCPANAVLQVSYIG